MSRQPRLLIVVNDGYFFFFPLCDLEKRFFGDVTFNKKKKKRELFLRLGEWRSIIDDHSYIFNGAIVHYVAR